MLNIFFAGLLAFAFVLTGCGGGDPEPEMMAAAAAVQSKVESVSISNRWPDIYPRFGLRFDSAEIVGFAAILGAVQPEDTDVVWHSGNISSQSPNAPRAAIQRGPDGKLFVELPLFYAMDSGIFVLAKRGFTPYQTADGQPAAYMLVDQWQLPPEMVVVEIPGPNGPRRWIDFQQ